MSTSPQIGRKFSTLSIREADPERADLVSHSQESSSSKSRLMRLSKAAYKLEPKFLKLSSKITLHADGVDDGGHGDHHGDESSAHPASGELKASMSELFYDLIFVVIMIRLAEIIKYNFGAEAVFEVFLIFTVCWLTWFHLNMLMTRFKLPYAWQPAIYGVMLFTLGIAAEVQGPKKTAGIYKTAFHVSLLCSRLVFIVIYSGCCKDVKKARPMIKVYLLFLLLSAGVCAVAIAVSDRTVRLYCTIAIAAIELMMYPLTLETVSVKSYLPINVEHLTERSELWVILILGESIISMVMLRDDVDRDTNFYLSEWFAFTISYLQLCIMMQSQPQHADDPLDTHALDRSARWGFMFNVAMLLGSFGIFGIGTGFKLLMAYGVQDSTALKQEYALFLTCSISATYVIKWFSRLTHKWTPFDVWGFTGETGIAVVEAVQLAVGLGIAPLGLLVSYVKVKEQDPVTGGYTGEYAYERTGLQTWELLACIAPIIALLLWLEHQLQMPADIIDLYFQFCRKMQVQIAEAQKEKVAPKSFRASKWGSARTGVATRKNASADTIKQTGYPGGRTSTAMFQTMVSGVVLSDRHTKYRVPGADHGVKGTGITTIVSAIHKVRRSSASTAGSRGSVDFKQVCDLIEADKRSKGATGGWSKRKKAKLARSAAVAPIVVIPGLKRNGTGSASDLDVTEV